MSHLLPSYYKRSLEGTGVMHELLQSARFAMDELDEAERLVIFGFFIMLTTDISKFELDVGIVPDDTVPLELRRQKVLAKLRSTPYATKAKLANIVKSFFEGDVPVEVVEKPPFGIKLEITDGQPSVDVLKNIIEAIKKILPAHLTMEFETDWKPKSENYLYATLQSYTVVNLPLEGVIL